MINVYQYGNTVRLECKFYDYNNELINPHMVKLTIYNYKYQIIDTFNVSNSELGVYVYDYTTISAKGRFYYEWYGEIDGNPYLRRGEFETRFK